MPSASSDTALEARARRVARKANLTARKSRWRLNSIDNYGEFQIIDPSTNVIVAGEKYDLSAEVVIEFCSQR
jgi:hypothetical protein